MELNTVLFAGIGAGVVVGMLLGIGLMCWLVMARNDPISAEEDPDMSCAASGCALADGNCDQGRKCPRRAA